MKIMRVQRRAILAKIKGKTQLRGSLQDGGPAPSRSLAVPGLGLAFPLQPRDQS